jgi:hypothetical protein
MMRRRLSNRRQIITETFKVDGITYHGSVGVYDDGSPGEIWLEAGRVGSAVQQAARSAAIAASLALQYGCEMKTLRGALPKLSNGKPADSLGQFLSLVADATH